MNEADIRLTMDVPDVAYADEPWDFIDDGHQKTYYRKVLVEEDGSVLVWDSVAGHYTRCHSLPKLLVEKARAEAMAIRARRAAS